MRPGSSGKPLKPPIPLNVRFPSTLEQKLLPVKLGIQNALYPVPTWLATSVTGGLFAQQFYKPSAYTEPIRELLIKYLHFPKAVRVLEAAIASLTLTYGTVFVLRALIKWLIFGYHGYLFDGRKPSLRTKLWAAARRLLAATAPPQLGSCESLLPTLPLPPLEETIERYLESVVPLMNENEYAKLRKMANEFLRNEGPKLQSYARFHWWTTSNYVTALWEKYAYLSSRQSLVGSTSVGWTALFPMKWVLA